MSSKIDAQIIQQLKPLFKSLTNNGKEETIPIDTLLEKLEESGLKADDVRVEDILGKFIKKGSDKKAKDFALEEFVDLLENRSSGLIKKALLKKLAIADFVDFKKDIEEIYQKTKGISEGEVKSGKNKNLYAISICSIDGQQLQIGDHNEKFVLQSVSKPINYAIALNENTEEKVHKHVGREPSGRGYSGLVLNQDNLPHNPMINAGAIMTCSLIQPDQSVKVRHQNITKVWSRLAGNTKIGFDEEVYNAEGSDQNMALSYYMMEQNAFPEGTDLYKTIDLYRRSCSIEMNIDQLSVAAASLANGGICPMTNDKIFGSDDIRDCLSLMLSCGMYDYSGEFAFLVGLPAKSGVSGAMMVVVPGLMGMAIYSPPLDPMGNPVRGIAFCRELVAKYSFHIFDHIVDYDDKKKDPRKLQSTSKLEGQTLLLTAAAEGELMDVQNLFAKGVSLEASNFDQRTPLHLAAAEGRYQVVEYLLTNHCDPNPKDRWGRTPLSDALYGNHSKTANLIRKFGGIE